jgi:hypothetical protein
MVRRGNLATLAPALRPGFLTFTQVQAILAEQPE